MNGLSADLAFVLALAFVIGVVLRWGFRNLPQEQWQFLASVPVGKGPDGSWKGLNLTYYGLFVSAAVTGSAAVVLLLLGSVGMGLALSVLITASLLALCIPSSSLVARLVEQRSNTLTIAGGSFVGILIAPPALWIASEIASTAFGIHILLMPTLAALAIGCAFGEGLGRLACISFGCCYGAPISLCHPVIKTIFARRHFVFHGATKKIAYDGRLEGQQVIPIQAITSVILLITGLVAVALFLRGQIRASFLLAMTMTQGWRVVSEFLRSDFRGTWKLSAYQGMAALTLVYAWIVALLVQDQFSHSPQLLAGLRGFWDPSAIIFLQLLGAAVFYYTGRSSVTASTVSFHVVADPIGTCREEDSHSPLPI